MHASLPFATWNEVLDAARAGLPLLYAAPMEGASAFPARCIRVVHVYKNGKLRVDPMYNQADPFTADAGHLLRFSRQLRLGNLVGHTGDKPRGTVWRIAEIAQNGDCRCESSAGWSYWFSPGSLVEVMGPFQVHNPDGLHE